MQNWVEITTKVIGSNTHKIQQGSFKKYFLKKRKILHTRGFHLTSAKVAFIYILYQQLYFQDY